MTVSPGLHYAGEARPQPTAGPGWLAAPPTGPRHRPMRSVASTHPDVAACLAAGASGIAVMEPLMRTPQFAAAYLTALHEVAT